MLAQHELRAKVFDNYWELIIPMRIETHEQTLDSHRHNNNNNNNNNNKHDGSDSSNSPSRDELEQQIGIGGVDMEAALGRTTRMWLQVCGSKALSKSKYIPETLNLSILAYWCTGVVLFFVSCEVVH